MTSQEKENPQQGGVNTDLTVFLETDSETQIDRVSMSGHLYVEVTPVVKEDGKTIYVIAGTDMQYSKRKSAVEAAVRHYVTQAFDRAWDASEAERLAQAPAAKKVRKSAGSSMSADLARIEAQMAAMMSALTAKLATGEQNGNHGENVSDMKVRLKAS